MKQTTKSIFIYIGGIFTGILLTLIFAFAAARDYSKKGPSYPENDGITTPQNEEDPDLTLFDSPKGKVLRQIGVYRYITRNEMEKTVPVVDFFDK